MLIKPSSIIIWSSSSPPPPRPQPAPPPTPAPPPAQPPSGFTVGPPKARVEGLEGLDESERKQHEEAKAFASVIVSDIFLYNQPKIEEGLRNGTLDQLLGGEFERGRRLYLQRVSPAIAKNTHYYDEAIQTMIDKKKKMLGL